MYLYINYFIIRPNRELLIEQKERESEEKRIKNLAIMKEKQAEQTEMRRQEVANKAVSQMYNYLSFFITYSQYQTVL